MNQSLNWIEITHPIDVSAAVRAARSLALQIGFNSQKSEEIVLVVSELGTNLVKHAGGGVLAITPLDDDTRVGIQIDSKDNGPGIANVEVAIGDGYSTSGSLGYGLGAVNRLADEFHIDSQIGSRHGTTITCRLWMRPNVAAQKSCTLDIGVATRPYPGMTMNGDAFVIIRWEHYALVSVIDGLGHGQYAQRASQKAREYIERHYDQPIVNIFNGVSRTCRATRGVVMALARFDCKQNQFSFASIGNVEARIFNSASTFHYIIRRGILGNNAPNPVVSEHKWEPGAIMVLFSDGLHTSWKWQDYSYMENSPASEISRVLLDSLAKFNDDATIIAIKGNTN